MKPIAHRSFELQSIVLACRKEALKIQAVVKQLVGDKQSDEQNKETNESPHGTDPD